MLSEKSFLHFNLLNFNIFLVIFVKYSERRYQCIGQWTENNIIYTYAKRLDVPTYECFLGALASPEEIFIKEAGEHCRRDIDPYRYSMQLNKTRACPKMQTKMDVPPSREYDDKLASTSSSYETTSSNGEVEYEYIEENHLSMSGSGSVVSSTEMKVQPQSSGVDSQNAIGERTSDELLHSIHPKLDLGTSTKPDKTSTDQNRSYTEIGNLILITSLLPLYLLLPLLMH